MAVGTRPVGLLFMIAFGLATFPVMFALSFFGSVIGLKARNKMKKVVPLIILMMGILLILRGLSLNIPYIGPVLPGYAENVINCP
jgi:uncharacterized protein